ncbi:MAG: CDP-alcohol phosphatidyltransferase family protein [Xanthobacteraceae bacterium]|nr:CDP-alcohol phosphatidyltransferase family protein [Xanthobacteraceae bacterium]
MAKEPTVPSPIAVRAFAVHVFTAIGAALGFLALLAASERRWTAMFWYLAVALFVDGIDGTFARKYRVAEVLPRWSGDILDMVVDFVTYVFVPAYAIAASGLLPSALAIPAGLLVVVTSALYFADGNMKTPDNYFRGFPALWNAAAFYLFVLKPAPWIATAIVLALAVLTFVPFKFVHPFRVARLRTTTIAALALWSILGSAALLSDLDPGPWIAWGLVVIAAYFVGIGLADPWIAHDRSSA